MTNEHNKPPENPNWTAADQEFSDWCKSFWEQNGKITFETAPPAEAEPEPVRTGNLTRPRSSLST